MIIPEVLYEDSFDEEMHFFLVDILYNNSDMGQPLEECETEEH